MPNGWGNFFKFDNGRETGLRSSVCAINHTILRHFRIDYFLATKTPQTRISGVFGRVQAFPGAFRRFQACSGVKGAFPLQAFLGVLISPDFALFRLSLHPLGVFGRFYFASFCFILLYAALVVYW